MQTPAFAELRPVGRPLGVEARAILQSLSRAPKPARDVAAELALPTRNVVRSLSRMVERGAVQVAELRRLPQANRPLAVYQLAPGGASSFVQSSKAQNGQ